MTGGNRTLLSMSRHHRCSEALCFYATHVLWRREVVGGWVAPIGDKMKLTCVTATFNCIKAGNRERLIRCVESVAKLKTEHEHLIYDGASKDGTAELLRALEAKTPGLKVVSEPDTGIFNALNKGVRDAKGEWFYVLGADDYLSNPSVMDDLLATEADDTAVIVAEVERDSGYLFFRRMEDFAGIFRGVPCSHQGLIMRTDNVVRHFGGFDETRYKVCSDWELMLKAHDAGLKHHYVFRSFANYAVGGASECGDGISCYEVRRIIERQLGLTERESRKYWKTGVVPLRCLLRFCNHPDYAYRLAARRMLYDRIKRVLRTALYPLVLLRRFVRMRCSHVQ